MCSGKMGQLFRTVHTVEQISDLNENCEYCDAEVWGYLCWRNRENVESCEPWATSTTQQVDLAFNIFFMVYFFIRVRQSVVYNYRRMVVVPL